MFAKIEKECIIERFFIVCPHCGEVIEGSSREQVWREALEKGWRYDEGEGTICCKNCCSYYQKIKEV